MVVLIVLCLGVLNFCALCTLGMFSYVKFKYLSGNLLGIKLLIRLTICSLRISEWESFSDCAFS